MLIEKIVGSGSTPAVGVRVDTVNFEWFEQSRKVMKKISSAGEEIGLRLTEPLRDGDVLYEDATRAVVASQNPCELIRVEVRDMREMGRVCFELGNRHLPLSISEDNVKTPYDAPTFEYLARLGFVCSRVNEKFTGFTEVKAHAHADGHTHGHGNE
ncbi:MAG: urease accessory protein UreE [Oscillospiraceae bacterium]|jgi:urease accessory protein|nr:urease accessory protein UreE [Oscillospiraceae bacterium]